MKKIVLLAAAASLAFSSAAFAGGHSGKAPSKKDVGSAVQAAVKSIEAAKKVRGEWRDSYKILGKAKKAYHKGDLAKAMKLAKQAESQGHIGKKQAMEQKSAGMADVGL